MKIRTAIPLLLASASIMLSGIGLALAQPPRVRVTPQNQAQRRITPRVTPRAQQQGDSSGGSTTPGQAGKLRPFRTGLEGRGRGRVSPRARIDFNLEDADLPDLVRVISRSTGKRFILPAKARAIKATIATGGEVTAAEAYRAFLSVLQINGMTVVPAGRYLKIVDTSGVEGQPLHIYRDGESTPRDDRFITRMHRLQNVSAEDVAQLLGRFKSREGNITAYAPTNTLIITDTGANIRRMLSIISEIDIPRTGEQIWIEPIHYANASEIAARLQEIFPSSGSSGSSRSSSSSSASTAASRARARASKNSRGTVTASTPGGSAPATIGQRSGESRITNIIADERTNSLIILATERAYLRLLELIRYLDRPVEGEGSIHVHQLQYADADDMASTLNSLIGGSSGGAGRSKTSKAGNSSSSLASRATAGGAGGGLGSFEGSIRIQPHKGTNSLVITASLHDYASLRRVIDRLDRAPRQVFIEAIIMELDVDRTTSLGVSYHGGAPNVVEEDSLGLFGFNAQSTAVPGLSPDLLTGLALGVRGPNIPESQQLLGISIPAFGVVMNALTQTGDTNVLSTPHIIALNNTTAEISVGSNIPLQTSGLFGNAGAGGLSSLASLAGGQSAAGGAAGLAGLAGLAGGGLGGLGGSGGRRDVGTTIRITPHVNDSGEIRLEIEEEISEAGNAQGTLGVVPISQRLAKTQVVVRDQQTVVIGGLMRDRSVTQEDKIPILGDIPLLGVLFRRQTTTTQKTNLLLFLTPYIIRGPEDLRAIFERKMRERQEFIDRYFVFGDRDWIPPRDYSRTRGLVSEILNEIDEDNEERRLEAEVQSRPPPEHNPRPPIGAAEPFEDEEGEGVIIIGPEDDGGPDGNSAGGGQASVGVSVPQQLHESENQQEQ